MADYPDLGTCRPELEAAIFLTLPSAMADKQETICAIATPAGRGGIGIIRVSGPRALEIAKAISGKTPKPRIATFCPFQDENKEIIDQGILLFFKAPASFTGEDVIELQAHGGAVVMNMLLRRVVELGARIARPGEFTERAFLNQKLDLIQAEAIADLIDSVSERAARSAVRTLKGEFSDKIDRLLRDLIDIRVYIEGALDFSEEEIDFVQDSEIGIRLKKTHENLGEVLQGAQSGRVLREGIKAVIVGKPNVGKSSLLNRLSRTDRAIVSDLPGTTRDIIEDGILIDGIYIHVTDTAGIRDSKNEIEKEGIRRALNEVEQSDLVLLMSEYGENNDIEYLRKKIPVTKRIILVYNKIDLKEGVAKVSYENTDSPAVYLSAKTGQGVDLLEKLLYEVVLRQENEESILLARERHISALAQSRQHIKLGMDVLAGNHGMEVVAEELRKAQQELGKITGEFVADDLLGEIFSQFCIGK